MRLFFLRDCRGKKCFGKNPEICWMWSLFEGWENMSFRSRGLFQRKRARTNERLLRSPGTCPPTTTPSFHVSTHSLPSSALRCATCRLPHLEPLPNTRNFYFCVRELSVSAHLCVLLIVSRDSWGPVDAPLLLRAILFSYLGLYTSSCSKADALFWKCSSERCVKSKAQSRQIK